MVASPLIFKHPLSSHLDICALLFENSKSGLLWKKCGYYQRSHMMAHHCPNYQEIQVVPIDGNLVCPICSSKRVNQDIESPDQKISFIPHLWSNLPSCNEARNSETHEFAHFLKWFNTARVSGHVWPEVLGADAHSIYSSEVTVMDWKSSNVCNLEQVRIGEQVPGTESNAGVVRDTTSNSEDNRNMSSSVSRLRDVPKDVQQRLIFAKFRGIAETDLCMLDALYAAFDLDTELIWYLFRLSDGWKVVRNGWCLNEDSPFGTRFGMVKDLPISPGAPGFLSLGTMHLLILPKTSESCGNLTRGRCPDV